MKINWRRHLCSKTYHWHKNCKKYNMKDDNENKYKFFNCNKYFFLWSWEICRIWRSNNQTEFKKKSIYVLSLFSEYFHLQSTPFLYNEWFSEHYPSFKFLLKWCFGDWTLSPSLGKKTYSVGPNWQSFKRELLDLIYSLLTSLPCMKTLLEIILQAFFLY
jgi:hypothetical protein